MERIYHTWDEWECYPAGLYENRAPGMSDAEADAKYVTLMQNVAQLERALDRVLIEWPMSCEHYLTNERMDRLAWLRSAAVCILYGIPKRYRSGFGKLTNSERDAADTATLGALNRWFANNGHPELTYDEARSTTAADLY